MAHVGRFYPHIEDLDFRFPEAPWRVPPKNWIVQGVALTGAFASDFPAQPWTVGLTLDVRGLGLYSWITEFPVVSGRTPSVKIDIALLMPLFWLGAHIRCASGAAGTGTVIYNEITDSDFSGTTFAGIFSATQPANLQMTSGGSAVPKPW